MSLPSGYFELAKTRGKEAEYDMLMADPNTSVYVRMVVVPEYGHLSHIEPIRDKLLLTARPNWILYAGPVPLHAVPVVIDYTEEWANRMWGPKITASTWGTGLDVKGHWRVIPETVLIYDNVPPYPWPRIQVKWDWVFEAQQPTKHVVVWDWQQMANVPRIASPHEIVV